MTVLLYLHNGVVATRPYNNIGYGINVDATAPHVLIDIGI